jgi:hypothetical protein
LYSPTTCNAKMLVLHLVNKEAQIDISKCTCACGQPTAWSEP